MERGLCFEDFDEQKICFMPTYKFNPNSRIYDTSRTLRQPSFTVIIFFVDYVIFSLFLFRIEFWHGVEAKYVVVCFTTLSTSWPILTTGPSLPFTKFKSNQPRRVMLRTYFLYIIFISIYRLIVIKTVEGYIWPTRNCIV